MSDPVQKSKGGRLTNVERERRRMAKALREFRQSIPQLLAKSTRLILSEDTSPAVTVQLAGSLEKLLGLLPAGALVDPAAPPTRPELEALLAAVREMPEKGAAWGEKKALERRLASALAFNAPLVARVHALETENFRLSSAVCILGGAPPEEVLREHGLDKLELGALLIVADRDGNEHAVLPPRVVSEADPSPPPMGASPNDTRPGPQ